MVKLTLSKGKKKSRSTFQTSKDRKKLRKQHLRKTAQKCKITNPLIKEDWNRKSQANMNFIKMGIATDPNKILSKPPTYQEVLLSRMKTDFKFKGTKPIAEYDPAVGTVEKLAVAAKEKEDEYNRQKATKFASCSLNADDKLFVKHLLDKYDHDDYKGMARDRRNHYQETPAAIRRKILSFCQDPKVFIPYCKEKGILPESTAKPSITEDITDTKEAMSDDISEKLETTSCVDMKE